MKKLFFSMIALLLMSSVTVLAQETVTKDVKEEVATLQTDQDEKVEIKADELPQAVRTTLSTEKYQDWTIEKAYHLKASNHYEVKLKKETESKTVKFDKDGNVV